MKSLLACVMWPTWAWGPGAKPETRWIYASYNGQLSRRDGLRHRRLIESKWYQQRWGHIVRARRNEEWSATKFSNNAGGFRLSTSVGGGVTGDHADVQVADDPLKPQEVTGTRAVTRKALEKAITWWDETMPTRMVNFDTSARVIIMQRLHEADLSGHVLRQGGYEHLCLPMEYEPKRKCMIQITGWQDPRTREGEVLWPEVFSDKVLERTKRELGARAVGSQLQQDPSPAGGTIFKRETIKRFDVLPNLKGAQIIQTWDCAFKDSSTSDYVAGFVLAQVGTDIYVLARKHARLAFSETCAAIRAMHLAWPQARPILIEDKANGPAVISVLKKEILGIKEVNPLGGKEARANAVEPLFDAGHVWFPRAAWADEAIEELCKFPAGVHDDQVDAITQGLAYLQAKSFAAYKAAMENLK